MNHLSYEGECMVRIFVGGVIKVLLLIQTLTVLIFVILYNEYLWQV